jgi:hypothetical protein
MSQNPNTAIATVGIDIGKNSFHVVGLDQRGAIVQRQKWSRGQVVSIGRTIHWVKSVVLRTVAGCRLCPRKRPEWRPAGRSLGAIHDLAALRCF